MKETKFKQTEVGMIPSDWDVKKIGEFTKLQAGGTPSTLCDEFWDGNIRWMNSGELNKKRIYDVAGRITELGLNSSSTHLIPSNCVLVGLAGQGKTRGTAAINYVELCTNQSIAALFPSKTHNSEYLYHNIDNRYEELRELSSGDGGRGGLNLKILANLFVALPSKEEQTAIANVLSDVDTLINNLVKLIAKKKNIKQGAMQQLLTGKIRLDDFSEKWIYVKIKDIFRVTRGYVLNSSLVSPFCDSCTPYPVFSSQTSNKGVMGYYRSYLYENAITWTTDGANAGDVNYRDGRFYCTNVCGVLLSDKGFANECIAGILSLCSKSYVSYVGNPKLMNNVMAEIEILIPPSLEEQTAIANVLSDMDTEISALETKLAKYRQLKTGMMQQLLTGKIRLI